MIETVKALRKLGACEEAIAWAQTQSDPATAWRSCERGDWMLWILGRLVGPPGSDSRRPLVLAACACAREALRFVPQGEDRPRVAIETAERWALEEVRAAAADAYAASDAASDDAAYAAAAAAADAADAANAAAYAAYAASDAASNAAYAAVYAVGGVGGRRKASLRRSADIVREHFPGPPSLHTT